MVAAVRLSLVPLEKLSLKMREAADFRLRH